MQYQGLTPDDLANINALNRCFLVAMADSGARGSGVLAIGHLSQLQFARLAIAPFLLFSFREQDSDYWQRILADDPQVDLLDSSDPPGEKIRQLQMAGLGFLWQLSRRNPYAVRIVSGAPASWCERLAGLTLVSLLDHAAMRSDLLGIRFRDDDNVWRRLLGNGLSSRRSLRLTSQHCALQALLTRGQQTQYNRLPAAACRIRDTKV